MLAAWERADAAEKKHQDKLLRKEREAQAKAASIAAAAPANSKPADPKKRTHKLVPTRDRRAQSKAARLAEDGDAEAPAQLEVRREDGTGTDYATAVEAIQLFLQDHGGEASLEQVRVLLQAGRLSAAGRENNKIGRRMCVCVCVCRCVSASASRCCSLVCSRSCV